MKSKGTKIRHDVDENYMRSLFSSTISEEDDTQKYASVISHTPWIEAPYYLFLSVPEFKSEVDSLAAWKKCMGFNTKVVY